MTTEHDELVRLRAENELLKEAVRQHELRLQTLVESLPFDFWMMDETGRYIVQNSASRGHWGAAVGAREDIVRDPAVVLQWQDNNRRAFAGETIRREVQYNVDGELRHYIKVLAPVLDQGRVRAIAGVNLDITDSKRLAAQVERNHRLEALGVLAGGIAHDFNNQLMAILGNVSVLRRELAAQPDACEVLVGVEAACMRASGISRQLLTFARGGDPVRVPIDLASILTELVQFTLRGTTSRPELAIEPALWPVMGDAGQLQQVIHNLILNAHEAMPRGGIVEVTARNVEVTAEHDLADGRYVRITVTDHGVGIPAEQLARVFEPYFTTKPHGNGLGLAIVHSIARRHGGSIAANSREGHGTSMSLYVPAAERAPAPAPPRERIASARSRVLVLDDDELLRNALTRMLEELGCEVESFATTAAAVERSRAALGAGRPFEIAILDLVVAGDAGGLQCARRLAEIDPRVRTIMTSGYSDDAALANFERHGFVGRLAKPFSLADLSTVLERARDPDLR